MKKQVVLTLLAIFGLVGCSSPISSSLSSSSETPIEISPTLSSTTQTSSAKDSSTNETSSTVTSSGKESSSIPDSSLDSSVDSSSESSTPVVETPWPDNIANTMAKYLGGQTIPYINVGADRKLRAEWYSGTSKTSTYLEITGDSFDATRMATFQTTFENKGYTCTLSGDGYTLTAVNETAGLTVTVTADDTSDISYAYFYIKIAYDEPFDTENTQTAWSTEEATELASYVDGHALPYIYLGTHNPYIYHTTSIDARIYGWDWNDSIITQAKTAFEVANWTVVSDSTSLNATITMDDECILTATINATSSTTTKAYMTIDLQEGFVPDSVTDWNDDMKTSMENEMNGHTLPFFYLGTKTPTWAWSATYNRFTITGSIYRAEMMTLAKANLTTAGWTVVDYVDTTYGNCIRAYHTFEDGDTISFTLKPTTSATAKVYVYGTYIPACAGLTNLPAETTWDEDTTTFMTAALKGNTLPYIYLGTNDTSACVYATYHRFYIKPDTSINWNEHIMMNAAKVLAADGFTVVENTRSSYGTYWFEAEKTFENGDTIKVKLNTSSTYSSDPTSPFSLTAKVTPYLHVQLFEKYDDSQTTSTWDNGYMISSATGGNATGDTITKGMTDQMNGKSIPYFYLGTQTPVGYWTASTNTLTVYGGDWNTAILDNAKTVIAGDTYEADDTSDLVGAWSTPVEEETSAGLKTLTATKTFADTSKITITIKQPSKPTASYPVYATQMTVFYQAPYNKVATAWEDDVVTQIDTLINSNVTEDANKFVIPYLYLHSDDPAITTKATSTKGAATSTSGASYIYNQGMKLTGGTWDDRVVVDAESILTADGWETTIETRYDVPALTAEKPTADGSIVRILICKGSATATTTCMYINYDPFTTVTATSRAAEEETVIKKALGGNALPSFYVGNAYTVTENTTTAYGNYIQIATDTSKDANSKYQYLYNNYFYTKAVAEALTNDGYTVNLERNATGTTVSAVAQGSLTATKTLTDGSRIDVTLSTTTSKMTISAYYYEAFKIPASGAWTDEVEDAFRNAFDGYVAPYIYIGSSKDNIVSNTAASTTAGAKITLVGSTWDDAILTNAAAVLEADTNATWSYMTSFSKKYGKTFVASGYFTDDENETHYVNINIYQYNNDYGRPIMEVEYLAQFLNNKSWSNASWHQTIF